MFHFAWAPNNLAVNIVPWFSIPITVLKGIQWFIQEKNLLVVNFVIILQSKKLTWNITWKVTTRKIYTRHCIPFEYLYTYFIVFKAKRKKLFSFKLQIFPTKLDDGQWSCPICLITTFSYRTMKRHINTHTNSETFPCDSCGKIFSRKDSLTRHIKKSCTESNSFWKRPNKIR